MMSLPSILLILAAFSIGATVISALAALRSTREAQSAIFPIVREEESIRARRARIAIFGWLAMTALFLGGWLAALRLAVPDESLSILEAQTVQPEQSVVPATDSPPLDTATPPATIIKLVVGEASATDTPPKISSTSPLPGSSTSKPPASKPTPTPKTPTPTVTATQTPLPPTAAATETLTPSPPTATPTSLADAARIPTTGPRTPAPPGVKMGPIQFATDINPDLEAINPADVFPDGVEAIYAVYPFWGMEKGLDFAIVWYKNGAELVRDEGQWQFGDEARSYTFLVPQGPGLYKLELYINDTVMASSLFEIRSNVRK